MASIRYESETAEKGYVSAGIRFRARVYDSYKENVTEMGFVVVPTKYLGETSIADYMAKPGNRGLSAKVYDSTEDIVYYSGVDVSGNAYNDYQVIITELTRKNQTANLLNTEMTVAMYAVIDGKTVYTDTISCSYQRVYDLMHGE